VDCATVHSHNFNFGSAYVGDQIAHFRTACQFHFLRGTDHATWEHRADARDFVGAWERATRIDAEASLGELTASPWHDDVVATIDTYAADASFVLLQDRLAHRLLDIQADASAFILATKTLRILEHEATNITAASFEHSDLSKRRITQVGCPLLALSDHTLLWWSLFQISHFGEARELRVDSTAWQQGTQAGHLWIAWQRAPGVQAAALFLEMHTSRRLHKEATTF
jgi:hypothetical protein